MNYGELTRKLRRLGVRLKREGRDHELWWVPNTERVTRIPRHRGEIATGTVRRILRDLELSLDDLQKG